MISSLRLSRRASTDQKWSEEVDEEAESEEPRRRGRCWPPSGRHGLVRHRLFQAEVVKFGGSRCCPLTLRTAMSCTFGRRRRLLFLLFLADPAIHLKTEVSQLDCHTRWIPI